MIFFLGFFLKLSRLLNTDHASGIIKIVFYVALPALIIQTVSSISLSWQMFLLAGLSAIIIIILFFAAKLTASIFNLSREQLGVFIIGSLIMNNGFVMPFVVSVYGDTGFATFSFLDVGNALMVFTFVYFQAARYGSSLKKGQMVKKIFAIPPLWALLLAIFINITDLKLSIIIVTFLEKIGQITIPLVMLALGIYFSPKFNKVATSLTVATIRIGGGFVVGLLLSVIFGLTGVTKAVLLLCASAPVGYNTLVFSTLEGLDEKLAASAISYSIIMWLICVPFILYYF